MINIFSSITRTENSFDYYPFFLLSQILFFELYPFGKQLSHGTDLEKKNMERQKQVVFQMLDFTCIKGKDDRNKQPKLVCKVLKYGRPE